MRLRIKQLLENSAPNLEILAQELSMHNSKPMEPDRVPAAVLIPIILHTDHETILLTKRSESLRNHAGQISFPGGRVSSADQTPLDCALRETYEEVGIEPKSVDVLGHLGNWPSMSGFDVSVFVGMIQAPIQYQLCPIEVAQAFEVPAQYLLNPKRYEKVDVQHQNQIRSFYQIYYQNQKIWGFTGGLTYLLSRLLQQN